MESVGNLGVSGRVLRVNRFGVWCNEFCLGDIEKLLREIKVIIRKMVLRRKDKIGKKLIGIVWGIILVCYKVKLNLKLNLKWYEMKKM